MQSQLCFLKVVCFFPWLAGRFHNFELTQNREKTRNGLTLIFGKQSKNDYWYLPNKL
jgi:hypothetical protein